MGLGRDVLRAAAFFLLVVTLDGPRATPARGYESAVAAGGVMPTSMREAATRRKVIVFIQGVCTQMSGPDSSSTFDDLKELLLADHGYNVDDLLMYSYKGGAVFPDGRWSPNAYGPMDPIEQDFRTTSLAALHERLLVPYRARHPDTTFVLVGHSLGGVVAMEEVIQKVASTDSQPVFQPPFVSTIVTIDSPLHGVPSETVFAMRALTRTDQELDCIANGPAADLLVEYYNSEPTRTSYLQEKVIPSARSPAV